MATNLIQTSFFGGELSPNLYGMVDLAKYKSSTSLMRNWYADYRGGASTRFGTKFVNQAKISSAPVRLIPFAASFNVGYVMEFGDHYIRFHNLGAPVLNASAAITAINGGAGSITSAGVYHAGDWIFVQGVGGVTGINGNYYIVTNSASPYVVTDLFGNPPVWGGTYTSGGTTASVYEIASPYDADDLALVKFAQNVQFMVLCHPNYPTQLLTFNGPTNWTLAQVAFGATIEPPASLTFTTTGTVASPAVSYIYEVTATDKNGQESAPAVLHINNSVNINNPDQSHTITLSWSPVSGAKSYNVYRVGPIAIATIPPGTQVGLVVTTQATTWTESFVSPQPDFSITPPIVQNPFLGAPVDHVNVVTGGTYGGTTAPTVTIDPPGTPGGAQAQAEAILTGTAVTAVNVSFGGAGYTSVPNVTFSPPGATATAVLATPAGMPASVPCYFQQRLVLGAPNNAVQTLFFSQPGSPYNFNISDPTQADDEITAVLVSKQLNTVKSMVPMPSGLIVLTASSAFLIYGSQGPGSPVTALSIVSQNQAYSGANDVPPITANDDILYVQSKGAIVRDLRFNFYTSVYTGIDISVISEHLFFGKQILEWCWAEEPFKLVWAIRNDGILLSLTFSKEQEIFGWAHHDTQGLWQSTCAVTEVTENGGVDAAYFVVQRTVQGQTLKYIERMADRFMPNGLVDSWCVDCALQYNGPPTSTVTGLGHLEGLTVTGVADGRPIPPTTVVNGSISFLLPASKVTVGLPYVPQLASLPLDTGQPTIQGKRKQVGPAVLKVRETRGLSIGRNFNTLINIKDAGPPMLSPSGFVFGDEWVVLEPGFDPYGIICIQQSNPWPSTLLALVPSVGVGDTR